jgi:hypothetical protein
MHGAPSATEVHTTGGDQEKMESDDDNDSDNQHSECQSTEHEQLPKPKAFAPVQPLKKKRDRKANFSDVELKMIMAGAKENYKLLFNSGTTQQVNKKKLRVWRKIAEEVNKVNGGKTVRTARELMNKMCSMRNRARSAAEGKGAADEFTEQMLELMHGASSTAEVDATGGDQEKMENDDDNDNDDGDSDHEKAPRERKANFSKEEIIALVREVVKYYSILSSETRSSQMCSMRQRCWQLVAEKVNSVSTTERTWNEVKYKFQCLKRDSNPNQRKLQKTTDKDIQNVFDILNCLPQYCEDQSSIEAAWTKLTEGEGVLHALPQHSDLVASLSVSNHPKEASHNEEQERSEDAGASYHEDSDIETEECVEKDASTDYSPAEKQKSQSASHVTKIPESAGGSLKMNNAQKTSGMKQAAGDPVQGYSMDNAVVKLCNIVQDYLDDLANIVSCVCGCV